MTSIARSLICCAMLLCSNLASAQTNPAEVQSELQVGVRIAPPFVIQGENGFEGIAIELWEDIARENGWRYQYKAMELQPLFAAVSAGRIDVAVGALSVTAEREEILDFSQPFSQGGLGIATVHQSSSVTAMLMGLLSGRFLLWILGLVVLLCVIGILVWLLERRRNPEHFGGSRLQGIGSGFWWAAVTMSTVGYGDKAPVSPAGRFLAVVWMFAAILLVSVLTGSVSASMTVGALAGQVNSADDLPRVRVASIMGSTGSDWLARRGIRASTESDVETALERLAAGKLEAVVHDAAILQYLVQGQYEQRLEVLAQRIDRQYYAFAMPDGRPEQREAIDHALLKVVEGPDWNAKLQHYLGNEP